MYWLLDLSAKGPDPAGLKISLRFGAGTELSPLMGDRYWLERGLYWLLSQRLHCLHQVIWSSGTPADLPWIIVNLKSNSRAKFQWAGKRTDGGMKRWTLQIKPNPSKKNSMNVPSLSCRSSIIRLTVLCVSPSCLASSSSTSSLILLLSPEWSRVQRMSFCKCLTRRLWSGVQAAALSVLCCSKC